MTPEERDYLGFTGPERLGGTAAAAVGLMAWGVVGPFPWLHWGEALIGTIASALLLAWIWGDWWRARRERRSP